MSRIMYLICILIRWVIKTEAMQTYIMLCEFWEHKTSLVLSLFIKVPVPIQDSEQPCTCLLRESNLLQFQLISRLDLKLLRLCGIFVLFFIWLRYPLRGPLLGVGFRLLLFHFIMVLAKIPGVGLRLLGL